MISDGTAQFQIVDQKQDGTDIDALKTELEAVKSSLAAVQTAISDTENFKIIYPNGGTASSPKNVSNNKKYTENNPFPGYHVFCIAQVKYNNKWGDPGWAYSQGSYGVKARQLLPDDKITVTTGSTYVRTYSSTTGDAWGNVSENSTSLPCRVLVYKLGKIGE